MKSLLISILLFLPSVVFAKCVTTDDAKSGYYYTLESSKKSDFCYKRYLSSNLLTVVTLKHISGNSDFDVEVYSNNTFGKASYVSNSSGAKSELLVLPMSDYSKNIYIRVVNHSGTQGKYQLYVHQIDIGEIFGEAMAVTGLEYIAEAFISEIFGVTQNSSDRAQADANRAAVALVSGLQGNSLSNTTETMLINEIRREAVGNGFVSSFIVNFGVTLVRNIYSKY